MPEIVAPLEREFKIRDVSNVTDDDPIIITVRQASQGDHLKRQMTLSRPITRAWDEKNNFSVQDEIIPMAKRMAVDVWLTMASCNITHKKKLVFPGPTWKMTLADFEEKWAPLDPAWAQAIYDRVMRVNPDWALGGPDEVEDDELLTPGEEDSGSPVEE